MNNLDRKHAYELRGKHYDALMCLQIVHSRLVVVLVDDTETMNELAEALKKQQESYFLGALAFGFR